VEIESYRFGEIVIGGETYRSDVIIGPGTVKAGWWRSEGHRLSLNDLREVFEFKPEVLIVGTGFYGRLEISPELAEGLNRRGIALLSYDSRRACSIYNTLSGKKVAVAALHLTC